MKRKGLLLLGCCIILLIGCTQKEKASSVKYWHDVERELRYTPDGTSIVSVNGKQRFTRALYGTNTAFRIETSDFPEFSFYMPPLGGAVYLALANRTHSMWVMDAEHIESRYQGGSRIYQVEDPFLQGGSLEITALALPDREGLILKSESHGVPSDIKLVWIYGGASDAQFERSGDMGTDKTETWFIKPEGCVDNVYTTTDNGFSMNYTYGRNRIAIDGVFSSTASIRIADASRIEDLDALLQSGKSDKPVAIAEFPAGGTTYLTLFNAQNKTPAIAPANLPDVFDQAEAHRRKIADRVQLSTPDPFLNPIGGNLAAAADGVWESPVFLHGAIGWRTQLNGWRAAYCGDFLGWHDRGREHFTAYGHSQMIDPPTLPIIMDTTRNLARLAEIVGTPMFSEGYISRAPNRNDIVHHYDMNMVFIDALLWHLCWTGDMAFAEEIWPVLERHLKWEKRNYDPDGDGLYDAYCCIWASDALGYSSGGVTHSSAYNYRANRVVADIAARLGKDPKPYREEAQKIRIAMDKTLWLADRGWWAEFVDFMGNQNVHPSAALWSIYHAVEADISGDNLQAYQAGQYIDKEIPHIPVWAKGLEDTHYYVLATTNWMPYRWSINNVAFAENAHTALALFLGGRYEQAYDLMKGTILDGMYIGGSPGNFGQISFYDAVRSETYRDFSDPIGVFSRTLVQGLFGITPDAINGKLEVRPGFPAEWNDASFSTSDIGFSFERKGNKDTYSIQQTFPKELAVTLRIPAMKDRVASLKINGQPATGSYESYVGRPLYRVECGTGGTLNVEIEWAGNTIVNEADYPAVAAKGDRFEVKLKGKNQQVKTILDPQGVWANASHSGKEMSGELVGTVGHRTLFAQVKQGDAIWYLPIEFELRDPIDVVNVDGEAHSLQFRIRNNSNQGVDARYTVNGEPQGSIRLGAGKSSGVITVAEPLALMGTNRVEVNTGGKITEARVINWTLENPKEVTYEPVNLTGVWNDRVNRIFRNQYLTPRSPYGTLQIPVQGIGDWCGVDANAYINDIGLRSKTQNGLFTTPMGVPFTSVADTMQNNIAFTSIFDNYPETIRVPLSGNASHAYLLMAGSTNHMQCRFVNGVVTVHYTDGSSDRLELIPPESWAPIQEDFYADGAAFHIDEPRPYRVVLGTGAVSRDMTKDLGLRGTSNRIIPGGGATILDLPLDKTKTLQHLTLTTEAYEVVIGLMAVTLVR